MPRLDFYAPGSHRRPFVKVNVGNEEISIGRGADCTVQLEHERVSRRHAVITPQGAGFWIQDTSMHGTRLNAEILEGSRPLHAGDRIYIEDFIIVFQDDSVEPRDLTQEDTSPD